MNGLIRRETVIKRCPPEQAAKTDWTYCQEWLSAEHPDSGMYVGFDVDGTASMTAEEAFTQAIQAGLNKRAVFELLRVWYCGLLQ